MSDRTPAYYMLAAAAATPPATVTGYDQDRRPRRISTDPRRLMPSEVISRDHEDALLERRCRLLCLCPAGPVEEDPGDPGYYKCPGGWTVTAAAIDLSPVLGPQAAQIMTVIAQAEYALAAGGGPAWNEYADATSAICGDSGTAAAFDAAHTAARDALAAIGADIWFWSLIGAEAYGPEVLALAARDLTGLVPGWTLDAYNLLTRPWSAAFGPAHPGDAIPAAAAAR